MYESKRDFTYDGEAQYNAFGGTAQLRERGPSTYQHSSLGQRLLTPSPSPSLRASVRAPSVPADTGSHSARPSAVPVQGPPTLSAVAADPEDDDAQRKVRERARAFFSRASSHPLHRGRGPT